MSRNTVGQKALSFLLCFALVCSIFSLDTVGVYADQPTMDESHLHDSQIVLDLDSGSIMFTAYDYNAYTFGDGIYHCFDSNATIIIRQSSTNSTTNTIMDVGTPYPVNLALDGVNIDVSNVTDPLSKTNDISNTAKHCALCLSDFYGHHDYPAVNLTLKDSNYLKSGSCFAGLQVDGGQTLNIDGNGSLTATGGLGAAGIGGGANIDQENLFQKYGYGCGTIKIHGGTVTANGGTEGAFHGSSEDIFGGAGIGGGGRYSGGGSGGTVSISGGTVTAIGSTALANSGGSHTLLRSAGIGGAGGIDTGGSGGTITISGGTVTAKSGGAAMEYLSNAPKNDNFGNYGLQYGGSISQGGQTYHIYYKYINGFGYLYHATWENGSMDNILQVPTDGAAIGSGGIPYNNMQNSEYSSHTDSGNGGTITISGGTVTAESTETTDNILGGADIGNSVSVTVSAGATWKLYNDQGCQTEISNKTVDLKEGDNTAYIKVTAQDGTTTKTYTMKITRAASSACDITGFTSPSGAAVSGADVTASVGSGTASLPVSVTVSAGATWKLYNDQGCQTEISNKIVSLNVGVNTVYVKVTAQDGTTAKTYTMKITRAASSSSSSSSGSHSSSTSTPSLPSTLTDAFTGAQADLSGATFPPSVTGASLSVTPETSTGAPQEVSGGTADPQGAAVYKYAISDTALNIIGTPLLYNIKLLDQSGNSASFTGSVTVQIPLPAGIHGTPHVFRYEESTGTFTDLGATVQDGYLVFSTNHFSYYVVAGTGNSITLDTKNYQMPVGGKYQIGVKLTGSKAMTVKVYSTSDKTATVAKLKNGNYQVTGNGLGTAYIMFDVYDNKNKLLTHASVRVDVKTGIRPRGDSTRQIGIF
ncbi:Cadherin-like beta sandwich domain protein [Caprobacter fermentans]|uniref:Cadherin-like beta sandwich domain protein n=1 Tax=Caproicibacter fermentans TaxID=2576756 RepID=A0A6N8HUR5_9FIRM|nr:cadherin-like beta sandwich domain-containing protein [Caproicibacter fermentans]MVB09357.1 Cadherin-like beta sandwich domain protein [Caproicibacter fermentans]